MIVTFEVDITEDGALLFDAIADIIRVVENVDDVASITPFFSLEKPNTATEANSTYIPGHVPGCRITRSGDCTCGPVPR